MIGNNGIHSTALNVWVVVPAAGQGLRMGSDTPKQHLQLCGKTILQHTLTRLCGMSFIRGVVVGLSSADRWWQRDPYVHSKLLGAYAGGKHRQDTVYQGLQHLLDDHAVKPSELVMVHDAARPCITCEDVLNVVVQASENRHGAVLGSRLKDTIKSSTDDGMISGTLDRNTCWRAFTPQAFKIGDLMNALEAVRNQNISVTDEAMAMEYVGRPPIMVQGSDMNIKITDQADLSLAERFLKASMK